jgi:predicted glycosyltransferase
VVADGLDGGASAFVGVPGFMFYSHDTYGLGHLRRTLAVAHALCSRMQLSQLIATGSPLAHSFRLPAGADYVKLPSVVKVGRDAYESRHLAMPFAAISALRREILLSVARHFRPQLLVVDNAPGGLKDELVPTLRYLKSISCRLVLGLRDVIDEPELVRPAWARDGSYDLLERLYDRILVYGEREIYDLPVECGFPPDAADKTRFVGYLGRARGRHTREEVRAGLGVGSRRLALVMVGGGQDGYELLRTALDAAELGQLESSFDWLLLGGPMLRDDHRRRLLPRIRGRSVVYSDFIDDVESYIQAADVVVSMGGYNSVCELLSLGTPALIVPRVWPRREQLIRAQALSQLGLLHWLDPSELAPERLLSEMSRLLDDPPHPERLSMNGLAAAADAVKELLPEAAAGAPLARAGGRHG